MKRLTVTIDRPEGSDIQESAAEIKKVVEVLRPLGVRIRITRSTQTLTEDKAWRKNEPTYRAG
jgi:hypothetical protein